MTYETINENESPHWNVQTVKMWKKESNGQHVAIERGVTHGKKFTVTIFASPFWEEYEPIEYLGSFNSIDKAEKCAIEYLKDE